MRFAILIFPPQSDGAGLKIWEARILRLPKAGKPITEMDIDYNFWHDSNPECSYGGTLGRYKYQNIWYNQGLGGSAEFDYHPKGS